MTVRHENVLIGYGSIATVVGIPQEEGVTVGTMCNEVAATEIVDTSDPKGDSSQDGVKKALSSCGTKPNRKKMEYKNDMQSFATASNRRYNSIDRNIHFKIICCQTHSLY